MSIDQKQDELQQLSFKLGTLKISNAFHQVFILINRKILSAKLVAFQKIKRQANSQLVAGLMQSLSAIARVEERREVVLVCWSFHKLKKWQEREPILQKKTDQYKKRSYSMVNFKRSFSDKNKSVESKRTSERKRLDETKKKTDVSINQKKKHVSSLQFTFNNILTSHH